MSATLLTQSLSRRFGATPAVKDLSFEVGRGELYGLVGPDGAGKTATIRMVAGLIAPDSGSVRVLGRDPLGSHEAREALGLLPQQHSLYGDLSIDENLRFFGQLFCLPRRTFEQRRERLLTITRLGPFVDRRADALSGGMYKKLALACALLHQPEVLVLDEPTNGVDPVSRRELWALLYELVAEGMTVLLSTPYMEEAARCHRVGLMHKGRLLAEGTPSDLVDGFDHSCLEVSVQRLAGDRERLDAALADSPDVVAASPAGARLRIVVRPGGQDAVHRVLDAEGASYRTVAADFEDLFLAKVAAESGSARALTPSKATASRALETSS
jgi:ABC-2 type transport system ATP-binding protein